MQNDFLITTFYLFLPLNKDDVEQLRKRLTPLEGLKGLIITGKEGLNGTVAASDIVIAELKKRLNEFVTERNAPELVFKDSHCHFNPFRMFKIKERKEIVTIGDEEILPEMKMDESHLEPEAWDEMLQRDDVVCVDTRNWYETDVGKFENALDPRIDDFQEFPKYLEESGISKDKKLLMYCTGGIRCEKASIDARQQGFKEVYQLKGGILNYFAKRGQSRWEGECFVFDNRVAVDANLNPSTKYQLCPHCGQPGAERIECSHCDTPAIVCKSCLDIDETYNTCSKNCRYQYQLNPERKGKKQMQGFRAALQTGNFNKN